MKKYLIEFYFLFVELCCSFTQNKKGLTAIEYGLIACCLASFLVFVLYGNNGLVLAIEGKMTELANRVTAAVVSLDK